MERYSRSRDDLSKMIACICSWGKGALTPFWLTPRKGADVINIQPWSRKAAEVGRSEAISPNQEGEDLEWEFSHWMDIRWTVPYCKGPGFREFISAEEPWPIFKEALLDWFVLIKSVDVWLLYGGLGVLSKEALERRIPFPLIASSLNASLRWVN